MSPRTIANMYQAGLIFGPQDISNQDVITFLIIHQAHFPIGMPDNVTDERSTIESTDHDASKVHGKR